MNIKMKTPVILVAIVILFSFAQCRQKETIQPKMAMLIVVDQLRAELIIKYKKHLSGGLGRLLSEGAYFEKAFHDHGIANSAPGHATINTGSYPKNHGIVDNAWAEESDHGWTIKGNNSDSSVAVLGEPGKGGVSPKNRLRDGIIDWVGIRNESSIRIAVGQGTTSTNNIAPLHNGEAYWASSITKGFTSSTYFMKELPAWVMDFNLRKIPTLLASNWRPAIPSEIDTIPDNLPYENRGRNNSFPHNFSRESSGPADATQFYDWFMGTPAHDRVILEFAKEAVRARGMGKDDVIDFLSINLSSLDDNGHVFGPQSREQLDALLKLDAELGFFLKFLDTTLGKGNYMLALTGDHGCGPAPESIQNPAGRVSIAEIQNLGERITRLSEELSDKSFARRSQIIADTLKKIAFIEDAYSIEQLSGAKTSDTYLELYKNSFIPGRIPAFPFAKLASFGVMVRLKPYHIPDYATGVHGSPYPYDREVPLFFYGAGFNPARYNQQARSIDIAPTIAKMLHVAIPHQVDGKSLF
jgi:predicted AlkP superfamily pyrophosphatase or phosphodiesterase